ncbi:hypothetical protein ACOYW6_07350 [Parablastomonas sp. CN1-191]|uniref:hypothetical protein n=1 Tax=Parablastomonas sp. CN1-191 TaxID=3400908 RepID=UPI003BF771EF
MHIHLPKPLHGWREFLGEVGIIVMGVIIALGLEAWVSDVEWQSKVAEARTQLRHEVGNNLALMDDRISIRKCVDARLNELSLIVTQATKSGRIPSLGPIGGPPSYTFPTAVWDSQVAAETVTHFPAEQIAAISRAYRFIDSFRANNAVERAAWLKLSTMVGPGRPVDPASLSELIEALKSAQGANAGLQFRKEPIFRVLEKGGLGDDFPQLDPNNPPVLSTDTPIICEPIGRPAKSY